MAWQGHPSTCGYCSARLMTEAEYNAHFTQGYCNKRISKPGAATTPVSVPPVPTKSPTLEYRGVQYLIAECHRCKKVRPLIEVGTTKRCRGCVWDLVQEVTKIHSTLQEAEAGGTKK